MDDQDVLLIAFDGLDYNFIQEWSLENVKQEEFGTIDNSTGIDSVKTSELFASVITGETYKIHGVRGFKKKERFPINLIPDWAVKNIRGFHGFKQALKQLDGRDHDQYTKEDLDAVPIFDKIDNSRAMYIPSYNPSPLWMTDLSTAHLRRISTEGKGFGYFWDMHEHLRRKKEVLRDVNGFYDFVMVHFFRPDEHQHQYGDPNLSTYDEGKLKTLYEEVDELAEEIIEFFSNDFDLIIFMSDHGLPTEDAHNENAFYSCNKELFGDETPHITDFHDKILELTGNEDKVDS